MTESDGLAGTKHIQLESLIVDGGERGYQRDLNRAFVEKIARSFDPNLFGVVEVSEREGKFYVVDGQHRVEALRLRGFTNIKVPCVVRRHRDRVAEARHFTQFNTERKRPTPFDLYRSDRVAEVSEVLTIDAILRRHGLKAVSHNSTDPIGVRPIGAIREILHWHGEEMLERVLSISLAAWPNDAIHGRSAVVLDTLTAFIATHAARGRVVEDAALIKVCARWSAAQFADRRSTTGIPAYKAMAAELQEPYNRAAKRMLRVELLTPSMYTKRPRRPAGGDERVELSA